MKAANFSHLCKFIGGKPSLIFRDHVGGRIMVFRGNCWIATICPGKLLGLNCQAALLTYDPDPELEWRGSYSNIASALSEFQQSQNWDVANGAFFELSENDW